MSSRFHQKYHRYNHHSVPPGTGDILTYPDQGYDPIASFDSPFAGEFYSTGNIIGEALSANNGLYSRTTGYINQQLTVGTELSVGGNLFVGTNAIIQGDLTVIGDYTTLDTTVYATSALEITNTGTGPALKVTQTGYTPIAQFIDAEGSQIIFDNNSNVGIGVGLPEADLHINREGFQSEVKIEGSRSILTLTTNIRPSEIFSLSKEENNLVIFFTNTYGTPLQELYQFKNNQATNLLTILSSGKVGINNDLIPPNKELTVFGEISATKALYVPKLGVNVDTTEKEVTIRGELSASGGIFVHNAIVDVDVEIGRDLKVQRNVEIEGTALIEGDTDINGNVDIEKTLTVHKTLSVELDTTLNQSLYVLSAVGIGTEPQFHNSLTVNGNISCTNLYIPSTITILPATETILPLTNDIVLNNHTTSVLITAFSNGSPSTLYTLTNESPHSVFLQMSSRLFVRGPNWLTKAWAQFKCEPGANPWRSWNNFKCSSIIPEIEIPQYFSFSLRMRDGESGSVW